MDMFSQSVDADNPHSLIPLPSTDEAPPPPKRRRSQAHLTNCCRTCRLRKVKCTGNPGGGEACSNCTRLELTCSFNNPNDTPSNSAVSRTTPSRSHTEAGTLRKRAQRACTECHSHKTRCSGDLPTCKRCAASNLTCEYTPAKRRFQNVPVNVQGQETFQPASQSSSSSEPTSPESDEPIQATAATMPPIQFPDLASLVKENILANKDLILNHLDAYFEYLYWMPCLGYIHKSTIYAELEEDRLQPSRAAAICSVAAFFVSPGPKAVAFAQRCSMHVEFHIFCNIGSLKEANLYLYSFDILHNHMNGKYAKCWQLIANACRLMHGLQLNWEVPGSKRPFQEQECARRLAWHLFNFDRIFAEGFEAYVCCREDNMKIRLPCPEDAFNANKEVFVEHLNDKPLKTCVLPGLHGYQVRMVNIRHHVLTMSKKFASGPAYLQRERWEPSKVMEDVRRLQLELSRFSSSLPDYMKLSDQNISRWIQSKEKQVFVLIHGLLCTAHIDLYRFSLPGIRERGTPDLLKKLPHDFIVKSQKQAIAHAITLSRFWETIYNQSKAFQHGKLLLIGDYNIAPLVQQCAKVLMTAKQHKLYRDLTSHSTAPLWRNEPADGPSIRRLVDSCLRILQPWSKVIPCVKSRYDELTKSVEDFDRTSKYEEETSLKLASSDPNSVRRLPGPHYILETAYMAQAQRDQMNVPPVSPAVFARFYTAALQEANSTHDPYTGLHASDTDWRSEYCPPGMPIVLAEARGLPIEQLDINDPPDRLENTAATFVAEAADSHPGVGSPAEAMPSAYPHTQNIHMPSAHGADFQMNLGAMAPPNPFLSPQNTVHQHQPIPYSPVPPAPPAPPGPRFSPHLYNPLGGPMDTRALQQPRPSPHQYPHNQ